MGDIGTCEECAERIFHEQSYFDQNRSTALIMYSMGTKKRFRLFFVFIKKIIFILFLFLFAVYLVFAIIIAIANKPPTIIPAPNDTKLVVIFFCSSSSFSISTILLTIVSIP
jgi:hypothetical protein